MCHDRQRPRGRRHSLATDRARRRRLCQRPRELRPPGAQLQRNGDGAIRAPTSPWVSPSTVRRSGSSVSGQTWRGQHDQTPRSLAGPITRDQVAVADAPTARQWPRPTTKVVMRLPILSGGGGVFPIKPGDHADDYERHHHRPGIAGRHATEAAISASRAGSTRRKHPDQEAAPGRASPRGRKAASLIGRSLFTCSMLCRAPRTGQAAAHRP
jgi:hypothetical protein